MYLSKCSDPYCPYEKIINRLKDDVAKLEKEIQRLKEILKEKRILFFGEKGLFEQND